MKYAFVAEERTRYPVKLLCQVLELSTSGYYEYLHRARSKAPDREAQVREDLKAIHQASRGSYGRPRLSAALRAQGHHINAKRVQRLMKEEGLRGAVKGGFKPTTTNSKHGNRVAENVLERRFGVDEAPSAWVSDITYIPTRQGWLYLAVIIALQTRQVLGYCLADHLREDLVSIAFHNAITLHGVDNGTLFHSDRGVQYTATAFRQSIDQHGFIQSMSRKGDCWDNAVSESFFATLKTEEVVRPYDSADSAHRAISSYIHGFYNSLRLHSALGYRSPNDYARLLKRAA